MLADSGGLPDQGLTLPVIPNFRWQIPDKLAGMSKPLVGMGAGQEDDLDFLRRQGITAVVSVTRRPLPAAALREHGISLLHLPIPDFSPPTGEQVARFVAWVDEQLRRGGRVAVHCLAGQGRTGTLLACYLVSRGASATEAVRQVRAKDPAAIETTAQEQAVHDWAEVVQRARRNSSGSEG